MQVSHPEQHLPHFRQADAGDARALAVFAERAFGDTFSADNTPTDLAAYCAAAFGEQAEIGRLADPSRVCFVVEIAGAIVAYVYLLIGSCSSEVSGPAQVEIQRFYVDRPWHGRGLAQRLMDRCVTEATARGGRTVWLGVWEQNARAIRFYERCGFRTVGSQLFMLGADPQHDLVMARPLTD